MSVQMNPEGRFLFIKGLLQGQCYTFAAPNTRTICYFVKTLRLLEKFREGVVIVGRDFNITLDPTLDTTDKTPIIL